MAVSAAPVLKNFSEGAVLTGLSPWTETPCGELTLSNYRFPWERVFEIGADIQRAG